MTTKFRTTGPDVVQPVRTPKPKANPHHRAIFDSDGNQLGHCGLGMSSAGVSRFTGVRDNKLTPKGWVGGKPKGPNKAARRQAARVAKSLLTDKGSNSK